MTGRLVALTGPAGCGKTTIACALEQRGFVRVRFAGPVKDMARALGLSEAQVDGDLKEVPCDLLCGKSPRQLLQWIGTELGRNMVGADLWVNVAMQRIDELLAAGRDVVVDDLRFNNEAEALAARGALMFGLLRNGAGTTHVHASEAGIATSWLTDWLDNNGSVEETLTQLDNHLEVSRANRQ